MAGLSYHDGELYCDDAPNPLTLTLVYERHQTGVCTQGMVGNACMNDAACDYTPGTGDGMRSRSPRRHSLERIIANSLDTDRKSYEVSTLLDL